MSRQGFIYILHFERPIADGHPCQHYAGWCKDLAARIQSHEHGSGARLTEVAAERGISFTVVRAWRGSRIDERWLKNQKRAPEFCPHCNDTPRQPRRMKELSSREIQQTLIPF